MSNVARLNVVLLTLVVGLASVLSQRAPGEARSQEPEQPAVRTLANGDRIGVVWKAAGKTVRGSTTTDPPPRRPPVEHEQGPTVVLDDGVRGMPAPVAETRTDRVQPLAVGDFIVKRSTALNIPSGFTSSVNEPSLGSQGDAIFQTGNWYAATSTNAGASFSFIDPATMFPESPFPFSAGFCCDQRVVQDPARDLVLWYLQYNKTGSTISDTNGVRLAVARGATDLTVNSWVYHDFTPGDFGFGLGKWLDFPHLQVSTNFAYFTSNVLDTAGGSATHAVVARIPLGALAANTPLTVDTFVTDRFTSIALVNGATSTMFFGSFVGVSGGFSVLEVMRWPEAAAEPSTQRLTGLSSTNVGPPAGPPFACPGPDVLDPCTQANTRIQTGWVTATELGFMWGSAQGTGRPFPFVRTAILDPVTLAVLSQPDMWNSASAVLYPAVAVNSRGHLGGQVSTLGGDRFPTINAFIRDDLSPSLLIAGWEIHPVVAGTNGADGRWGDFSGAVAHERFPTTWLAAGHLMSGGSASSNARPHNVWFMRERDDPGQPAPATLAPTFTPVPSPTGGATVAPTRTPAPTNTPPPTVSCAAELGPTGAAQPSGTSGQRLKLSADRAQGSTAVARSFDTPARPAGPRTMRSVPYDRVGELSHRSALPDTAPGLTTITCEGWEGTDFPGWVVFDNDGATNGDYCWGIVSVQSRFGSSSAWPAAGCADGISPAEFFYPHRADSWLMFGPFSLADASDADVHFSLWYQMERGFDFLFWGASADGIDFGGFQVTGNSTSDEPPTSVGWRNLTLDLKSVPFAGNLLGQPEVWVAWVFESDASGDDDGPFLDDVLIHKRVGQPPATPTRTPTAIGTAVTPTRTATPTNTATGTATGTPTPVVGAGDLGFGITSGGQAPTLSWQPRAGLSGYFIVRSMGGVLSVLPTGGPLGPGASSFEDTSGPTGLTCYALAPLGGAPPAPIGVSAFHCIVPSTRSGASAEAFTLRVEGSVARFMWQPPASGVPTAYLLLSVEGQPISLSGSATGTTVVMRGANCYALLSIQGGAPSGNADILCGAPGASTAADIPADQRATRLLPSPPTSTPTAVPR